MMAMDHAMQHTLAWDDTESAFTIANHFVAGDSADARMARATLVAALLQNQATTRAANAVADALDGVSAGLAHFAGVMANR